MGSKNIKRLVGFIFIGVCIFLVIRQTHININPIHINFNPIDINSNDNKTKETENLDNSTYLYNFFDGQAVLYDNDTFEVHNENTDLNQCYYTFKELENYNEVYTYGHSINNNYSIVEFDNNEINTIYEVEENKELLGLFPLTIYNDRLFFIKSTYLDDTFGSTIVELKDGELYVFENVTGYVTNGTVLNDRLYYTSYNPTSDFCELRYLNINDYNSTPTTLYTDLLRNEIINLNNQLYVQPTLEPYYYAFDIDNNTFDTNDTFACGIQNYYSSKNNLYFLIEPNENNTSLFNLQIIDATTKEVIKQFDNYISHKIDVDKITIYTTQGVFDFTL